MSRRTPASLLLGCALVVLGSPAALGAEATPLAADQEVHEVTISAKAETFIGAQTQELILDIGRISGTLPLPEEMPYVVTDDAGAELASGRATFDQSRSTIEVPVSLTTEKSGSGSSVDITVSTTTRSATGHAVMEFSASITATTSTGVSPAIVNASFEPSEIINRYLYRTSEGEVSASWGETVSVSLPENATWTEGVDRAWVNLAVEALLVWSSPGGDIGEYQLDNYQLSADARTIVFVLPSEPPTELICDGEPSPTLWITAGDGARGVNYQTVLTFANSSNASSSCVESSRVLSNALDAESSEKATAAMNVPLFIVPSIAIIAVVGTVIVRVRANHVKPRETVTNNSAQ